MDEIYEAVPSGICLCGSLSAYISQYEGYTRYRRLLRIAEIEPKLRREALSILIQNLKEGSNTTMYRQVYTEMRSDAEAISPFDENWCVETDKTSASLLEALDQDLNKARSILANEQIRAAHTNLGDFYYQRGHLEEARKSYSKCRDYCNVTWHADEMSLNVFCVSADQDEYILFAQLRSGDGDGKVVSTAEKLQVACAVAAMQRGPHDYPSAARQFLELRKSHAAALRSLVSPTDIAVYGTMLALVALNRDELRACLASSHGFRYFLDGQPVLLDFIRDFLSSNYRNCMKVIGILKEQYRYDIILRNRLEKLLDSIIDRIVLQFAEPYLSLSITSISEVLGIPVIDTIKKLVVLIKSGKLSARIDSVEQSLCKVETIPRQMLLEKLEHMTSTHVNNTRRSLFRISLMQYNGDLFSADSG
jgi:COP9 signalosome complex subunit 1